MHSSENIQPDKHDQIEQHQSQVGDKLSGKLTQNKSSFYLGSAMVGIARVMIGFPIEHPIDSIKTQWQAKPYMKNEFAIIKDIYHNKGVRGFYAGALPNLTRVILKNSYKYPLMVGLPNFYKSHSPTRVQDNKALMRFLTGFSIALIEATITCPIERLKVYFMTTKEKGLTYKRFYQSHQTNLFNELFRGFTPLFMRQFMMWTVFLQTDFIAKRKLRQVLKLSDDQQIPTRFLMMASVIVAVANTSMVMPLDCVKTHMEKVDPTSTYLQTFRNIYRQAGMLGFFTGIRLRFMLYLTNAIFAVNILERLETLSHNLKK